MLIFLWKNVSRACAKSRDGVCVSKWTSDQWLWLQMLYYMYILILVEIACIWPQLGRKTSTMTLLKQCKIVRHIFICLDFIFNLCNNHSLERATKHYGRFTPIFAWHYAVHQNFHYKHMHHCKNLLCSLLIQHQVEHFVFISFFKMNSDDSSKEQVMLVISYQWLKQSWIFFF